MIVLSTAETREVVLNGGPPPPLLTSGGPPFTLWVDYFEWCPFYTVDDFKWWANCRLIISSGGPPLYILVDWSFYVVGHLLHCRLIISSGGPPFTLLMILSGGLSLVLFVCFLGFTLLVDTEVDTRWLICLSIVTAFAEVPGGLGLPPSRLSAGTG